MDIIYGDVIQTPRVQHSIILLFGSAVTVTRGIVIIYYRKTGWG